MEGSYPPISPAVVGFGGQYVVRIGREIVFLASATRMELRATPFSWQIRAVSAMLETMKYRSTAASSQHSSRLHLPAKPSSSSTSLFPVASVHRLRCALYLHPCDLVVYTIIIRFNSSHSHGTLVRNEDPLTLLPRLLWRSQYSATGRNHFTQHTSSLRSAVYCSYQCPAVLCLEPNSLSIMFLSIGAARSAIHQPTRPAMHAMLAHRYGIHTDVVHRILPEWSARGCTRPANYHDHTHEPHAYYCHNANQCANRGRCCAQSARR